MTRKGRPVMDCWTLLSWIHRRPPEFQLSSLSQTPLKLLLAQRLPCLSPSLHSFQIRLLNSLDSSLNLLSWFKRICHLRRSRLSPPRRRTVTSLSDMRTSVIGVTSLDMLKLIALTLGTTSVTERLESTKIIALSLLEQVNDSP